MPPKRPAGRARAASPQKRPRPTDGEAILIEGARQNNLKGVNLRLPLNELIVVTGVIVVALMDFVSAKVREKMV